MTPTMLDVALRAYLARLRERVREHRQHQQQVLYCWRCHDLERIATELEALLPAKGGSHAMAADSGWVEYKPHPYTSNYDGSGICQVCGMLQSHRFHVKPEQERQDHA